LTRGLVERGVPLHGVGLQMHVAPAGSRLVPDAPPIDRLAANLERFAALGLRIHITEMDVLTEGLPGSQAERLEAQARLYGEIVTACLAVTACRAIVFWGATDHHSWIPQFTGEPDAPLLFDHDGRPKPAYAAVAAAVRSRRRGQAE
jgi:endo-1,4-beta-xylanase